MKSKIYFIIILLLFSCSDSTKTNMEELITKNYLSQKLDSLDIDITIEGPINNIIMGDFNQGIPIEVRFSKGDTMLYIIESDYMITDSLDNIHFIGGVQAELFSNSNCDNCGTSRLSSNKAILNSNSNVITATGTDLEQAIIESKNEKGYMLEADSIIIFNNQEDIELIKGYGNLLFNKGDEKCTGFNFVSDFKMDYWSLDNLSCTGVY